jgi:cytosine/adenosine deaminase-related metal-dependent hydrolase
VAEGMREIGIRGCLAYEVTDRGGLGSRDTTLEENSRWLTKVRDESDDSVAWFSGVIGAHASFTLEDRTLARLQTLCDEFDIGIHIHLGEGITDRTLCDERGWPSPLKRLDEYGLLRSSTILAHGVDLTAEELAIIEERGSWLVHNGRSNMNNAVGRAPVDRFPTHSCFGTDGIDANMLGEMRTSFYRGNEEGRGTLGFSGARRLWIGGYQMAREFFNEPFGSLGVGAPADFVVCNQGHKSPLTEDNWLSLLLFGFHPWDVREVWVNGVSRYVYGDTSPYDGVACRAAAKRLWDGLSGI